MEETKTTPPTPQRAAETPIEGRIERGLRSTVQVDLEAYVPLLEDEDMPDDQKLELLRALYAIMASFVDLGFSIEAGPCGQPEKEHDPSAKALGEHVYSSHRNFIERFEGAAGRDAHTSEKGV